MILFRAQDGAHGVTRPTSANRFMLPMRAHKIAEASHEPKCSAGFPTCGFGRFSSRPMEWRSGKPDPAV